MKIVVCLWLLVLVNGNVWAQRVVPLPGLPFDSSIYVPKYHGVVTVPGMSAAELQARAREWVALTFQDAHQVTQLDDAGRGVLIGRGYTQVLVNLNKNNEGGTYRLVSFTFRLDFRDGRYRYELRDLGTRANVSLIDGSSPSSNVYDTYRLMLGQYQWLSSATATLGSSQRQVLMGPGTTNNSDDYRIDGTLTKAWPRNGTLLNAALSELLDSLARHEKAPVAKW